MALVIRTRNNYGDLTVYASNGTSTKVIGREYAVSMSERICTTKEGLITGRVMVQKWAYGLVENFWPDNIGNTRYALSKG